VRALDRVKKYLFLPLSCLGESIVLRTYLRLSGVPSEIKLGVKETSGTLEAHAWVELPGITDPTRSSEKYKQFSVHPFCSVDYRLKRSAILSASSIKDSSDSGLSK
jgi:hypothetical protein